MTSVETFYDGIKIERQRNLGSERMNQETEEKMELTHEPVPGYRAVFFVAITIGVLYLGFILFMTLG
jgi:hypothetical protein